MMQDEIVQAARGWLGVKFHHQGRTRAAGVDCLGLLVKVAEECALEREGVMLSTLDKNDYGRNPDGKRLFDALAERLIQVDTGDVRPGDVGLFCVDKRPQHLAIVSDYPAMGELGMIHAYAPMRKVVEHRMDAAWRERMVAAFRFG